MAFWNRKTRVASVQPGTEVRPRAQKRLSTSTQKRAGEFAAPGKLGVVRFASGLLADAGARCTLRVEKLVSRHEDAWEPDADVFLNELLLRYTGRDSNQRELVRRHIWHYQTVGECVQYQLVDGPRRYYDIASPFAASWSDRSVKIALAPGGTVRDGLAYEIPRERAARLWIPDETWPRLATSPLMGVIEDCERYWSLGRRLRREADSALVGNGVIWIPDEALGAMLARAQATPDQPGQPRWSFEQQYLDQAHRNFDPDNDTVESIAPILWHWAKEHGKPERLELSSAITDTTLAARAEALESIARGLNYPQRLLIDDGADTNHWGMWNLDEKFAKNSLSPILERVCWGDLTETFFRRSLLGLAAAGLFDGDPDDYRIGFDISPVVAHPDQGAKALELNTRGLLDDAKTLELNGFDSNDLLDPDEFAKWIVRTQVLRQKPDVGQLPVSAETVTQLPPATMAALDAGSKVRETVLVGPYPGEETGWLDA